MQHVINVSLENGKVTARPIVECGPGDTVEWDLGSSQEAEELRVRFEKVQELPNLQPVQSEVLHPFTDAPVFEVGRITGTIRSDVVPGRRFSYRFFLTDEALSWTEPISETQDFGGLDIPPPPPRG